MRLDDVLVGTTALGFDTAPFIYFVERHPSYLAVMREIIRRVDAGELEGYSSVVTLTEVLTLPMRLGKGGIVQEYRDVLLHSRHFTPIPLNAALAERARIASRALHPTDSRCPADCNRAARWLSELPH
ncbi:MAG: hypothetical protein KatS3mg131_3380 [Candidatus Tectimicrobiota bacterium]|nr:MAG: hypothetical protein KatS3mg131_3380 [Candidatus Tectomicrobia bacterium]